MNLSSGRTWLEDVIEYVRELGGSAHYSDLYAHIEANPHRHLPKEWQAIVRRTIEEHSSDSDAWDRRRPDLFRSVDGKGSGRWALREQSQEREFPLKPGDEVRRTDLHGRFGGSGQGGINPSSKTQNVFLFADPETGLQHGYVDGWKDDGLFDFTGEGQIGDQEMKRGNAAIANHKREGRSLRLFSGSRGTVAYLGEFELDDTTPYYLTDAPETNDGPTRSVIVFRLRPVDARQPPVAITKALPEAASVIDVSIEMQHTEKYFVNPKSEATEAERTESALVLLFKDYIGKNGMTATRKQIVPKGEAKPLFTDLYVNELNLLVEAKGSVERGSFRMAIGQLADYRRFLNAPRCAILLPSETRHDLLELAAVEKIGVIWPSANGFEGTIKLW